MLLDALGCFWSRFGKLRALFRSRSWGQDAKGDRAEELPELRLDFGFGGN